MRMTPGTIENDRHTHDTTLCAGRPLMHRHRVRVRRRGIEKGLARAREIKAFRYPLAMPAMHRGGQCFRWEKPGIEHFDSGRHGIVRTFDQEDEMDEMYFGPRSPETSVKDAEQPPGFAPQPRLLP